MIKLKKRDIKLVYTVAEVSIMLNISEQTVRKMIKNNEIKSLRIGTNYRIPQEELNRILKTGQE